MKTGLLLLQSIASSALRSGRSSYTAQQWSKCSAVRKSGAAAGAALFAAAATGAASAGVGITGVVVGGGGGGSSGGVGVGCRASSTAMCSSSDDDPGVLTTGIPAAPITPPTRNPRRYIDVPDNAPKHNPLMPFPELSLSHDTYSGVTLDLTTLTADQLSASSMADPDTFGIMLGKALDIWTLEKRRGIWIKIPTSHAQLIAPACTQHGFDFQHAEQGYCVLTKWLPKESESRLPNGPTHQIGIGALVIHPVTGKMLAVQERSGPAAKRKLWKMPTGLTDPGEDIAVAAVRELKEETGLDCIFDKIICFRQSHGGLFGRSDMFFVCLCKLAPKYEERLKEGGEVELLPQEEEILMADWIDMDFYANQETWKESPLYKEMNGAMIHAARNGIEYSSRDESHGFVAKKLPVGFRPGSNTIYVSSKL